MPYLHICMLSILVAVTIFHLLFPDFVQFSQALKWDGENYIYYTLQFPQVAFGQTLNMYHFQRILPSGIIYYSAKLLGIPLTAPKVFYAFVGLNILLIFISFCIWLQICRQLALSSKGKLLGFTGLFVNFALLKMPFYYPVLTDVMAFTLGMSLLYFYLKRNSAGVLITGLIGAFTFPTVFYSSLLLFAFPMEQPKPVSPGSYSLWNKWLALLTAFGLLLLIGVFIFYRQVPLINPNTPAVLILSIAAVIAYFYLVGKAFYKAELYLQAIRSFNTSGRGFIALGIFSVLYIIIFWGAGHEPSPLNYKGFLANIVVSAIANPFTFLVSHAVYVGPVLLVLLYFIRFFIEEIYRYGLGLHLFVLGYVLLSINSETRLFINAWPFFVAFLCKSLEKTNLPSGFYILLLLCSLALSKFWYRIDLAYFSANYLDFPEQKYFMSIGPWMSDAMYMLQGGIMLLLYFWMYWLYFRNLKASSLK